MTSSSASSSSSSSTDEDASRRGGGGGGTEGGGSGDVEVPIRAARAPPPDATISAQQQQQQQQQQLRRKASQAADEGHDADIPSSAGYILGEAGELRRLRSIADLRRKNSAVAVVGGSGGGGGDDPARDDDDLEKANGGGGGGVVMGGGGVVIDDENDPNVVWWDGPDDPENPYNWPRWRKTLNWGLISAMTFIAPLASSIFAPGVPDVLVEFHSDSPEIAAFVVSVYVLGFAAGPVVIAPLSEIYGRVVVYHVCNLGFVAFAVACALAPSLGSLIAFRFLCGIFGCAPLTNGGGSIADMIPQESRGTVIAIYSVGPLFGPVVGPIAGGFLTQAVGWRWTFWLLAIAGGVCGLAMLAAMRESYAPVILQRRVERRRRDEGNPLLRSRLDIGLTPREYFRRGLIRPLRMLARSPVIVITALYFAVSYGYLYIMFTTLTEVFEGTYGFSTGLVGLSFLGVGIGSLLGIALYSATSDRYMQRRAAQARRDAQKARRDAKEAAGRSDHHQGGGPPLPHVADVDDDDDDDNGKLDLKPEYRLQLLPLGATAIPAGLFIYGWTAQYRVFWIVPILGTGITGLGNLVFFLCIQTYLVDAFTVYAASAVATNTMVRSVGGAVLPLAGLRMYDSLGLGWGNSLLAFIAVALIPVSVLLIRYGEYMRKRFEIKDL